MIGQYGDFEYQSGELIFPAGSDTVTRTATVRVCPGRCFPPKGYDLEFVLLDDGGVTSDQRTALGTILPLPNQPTPCTPRVIGGGDGGTPGDGDGDGDGDDDGDGDGDGDDDGDGDGDDDGDDDDGDDDGDGDG